MTKTWLLKTFRPAGLRNRFKSGSMSSHKSNNQILNNLFFQLCAINILINMIQPLNQLIDTIITGKSLGAEALQVYALFLPVNSFLLAVSCVLSKGVQITASHQVGKGDFSKSNETVSTAFVLGTMAAIGLSVICFIFSTQFAHMLGAGSLSPELSGYLRAYSIGIMPAIMLDTMMCLMQIEGRKKLVVAGSVCVLIINALGDLANVFFFHKGVMGMALATSLANIAACLLLGVFFIFKSKLFKVNIKNTNIICVRHILKNGLPSLAYYGSLVIRASFLNILILNTLGKEALVPMLVFTNYALFADVLIGGHGDSVLVLTGILFGEKDKKGSASLLRISIISGTVLMLIIGILTVYFSRPLAELMLNKNELNFASSSARALIIATLYLIPDIISCIEKKYIQGIGNGTYTTLTNFVYNVVVMGLMAFALTHFFGFDGLFVSFTGCYLVAAIFNSIYIIFFSSSRFEDGQQKMISYTINDLPECIHVSEEIHKYCLENGIDLKKSYLLGLFIEEVGKNIITHGFNKKHNNSIIVKVLISKDKITLCIKDNCVLFNPVHYYDTMKTDPDNIAGGIGIKMLMKLSKNVTYTTSFKLNNLLIEV